MTFLSDEFKRMFKLYFGKDVNEFNSVNTIRYMIEDEIDQEKDILSQLEFISTTARQKLRRLNRIYSLFMDEYNSYLDATAVSKSSKSN